MIGKILKHAAFYLATIAIWWFVILYIAFVPELLTWMYENAHDSMLFNRLVDALFAIGTVGIFVLAAIAMQAVKKFIFPEQKKREEVK